MLHAAVGVFCLRGGRLPGTQYVPGCSADPKVVISCREAQIRQVLLHLLQNALDELVGLEGIGGWNWR